MRDNRKNARRNPVGTTTRQRDANDTHNPVGTRCKRVRAKILARKLMAASATATRIRISTWDALKAKRAQVDRC